MKVINKFLSESKHPSYELLSKMNSIQYGWYGTDNKIHTNTNEGDNSESGNAWWKTYKVMSPKEVWKYKVGTCIDQTILEQEWFIKNLPNTSINIIWLQQFNSNDHMWLVFKDHNEFYHFEHSWGLYRGIHGPYKNIKDNIKNVLKIGKHKGGYKVKVLNEFKYQPNLNAKKFLSLMDYDYSKEDWNG